jgi:Flp pilus assembly pilin Flp
MMVLLENVKRFLKDERGLETTEYAVLAGLIAAGTVAVVILLRDKIIGVFNTLIGVLP